MGGKGGGEEGGGGGGREVGRRSDIRAAIEDAGGAIPFSRFMELALYGPHGFYSRRGRPGGAATS